MTRLSSLQSNFPPSISTNIQSNVSASSAISNIKAPLDPASSEPSTTSSTVNSNLSPWLLPLMYPLGRRLILPTYFSRIEVSGQENLLTDAPMILAPTHRSRWDSLIVPYAAGKLVTGKHLHFMVTADEMLGIQGWFIRRLGGFAVDTRKPTIATLRYSIELLRQRETMVIFPEGNIHHGKPVQRLKPGLARLALQAESSQPGLGVNIVPISITYSSPMVPWRSSVQVTIGKPLPVANYTQGSPKQQGNLLTNDLELALKALHDHGK